MKTGCYCMFLLTSLLTGYTETKIFPDETSGVSNFTKDFFRNKRDQEFDRALQQYSPVLKVVGLFIAGHKYLAKDARFRGREFLGDRSYFRHFPIPRLKLLYRELERACSQGAFSCIQAVYSRAKIFNEHKRRDHIYHPFYDKLDMFRYRTTASYYLCFFTLEKNVMMRKLHSPGACLTGFSQTREARRAGVMIKDWRRDNIPFQCSKIFYCPDPCYGRKSNGNVESRDAQRSDRGNPCRSLRYNKCDWSPGENTNFDDLIRNRFNITCLCYLEQTGFKWSSKFKMCVDRDECHERRVTCRNGKVCQNTKGRYLCVCKRGKKLNSATGQCEDMVLLPQLVNATSRRRPKKEKPSFFRRLEILFGVSSASDHVSSAKWITELSVLVVWIACNRF